VNAREKLAAGRLMCKGRAPYLATAIDALVPQELEGLGTVGVTDRGVLLWDPAVVSGWSVDEISGVMEHEVWHVLRDHAGRCKKMAAEPHLFNIAGDMEINDDLKAAGVKLPKFKEDKSKTADSAVYPGLFEEYYQALRQQAQDQTEAGKGKPGDQKGSSEGQEGAGGDEGEGEGPSGQGDGSPRVGGGWCGSAAGRALPNEPKSEGAAGGQADGRTEGELASIRQQTAEAIQAHAAKGQGRLPDSALRWAQEALKPPKVPWGQKLARMARGCVAFRAGSQDYHYGRPSRRQSAVGFGLGRAVLPAMRQPIPEVLVVVDTSGSMGTSEMDRALSETNAILKATSANVSFMACDAEVHSLQPIRRWQDALKLLKGGGGTDFRPVFEAMEKMPRTPDVMVFVTDGCGPAPELPPVKTTVIWLLVGPYRQPAAKWGMTIEVDEDEEK
jgi:predicted metal-dependent peptidase